MINREPNYLEYSLDELKCALIGLDEERFPERSALIRNLISEQGKRLKNERENEIIRTLEFLEKDLDGEHTIFTTSSSSGSKTVTLVANLFLTLFFIFYFLIEPTWLLGLTIAFFILMVVGLFELVTGQVKVSLDKEYLNITQLGLKLIRRSKKIPLNDIISVSLNTTTISAKGFPVNTYSLQAQLKNGSVQTLTVLKTEQEGLLIAEQINSVISKY